MKKISPKFLPILLLFIGFNPALRAQPSGWSYSMPISVTENSGTTLVGYQLKLVINTQSLISAGQMDPAGNDIRFGKNCSGTVLYHYWIDTAINTSSTVIWVKIDTLFASSTRIIYMYYGNALAPLASSINGTLDGPFSSTDSVSGGTNGGSANSQRGFHFSPNQDIVVTQFGKNEPTGTTRYLTLFDYNSQNIIQQTQVSGISGAYQYAYLGTRLWLTSGVEYVMELHQGASDGYYYQVSSQINNHLTYFDMRYCNSCTQNTFPTSVLSGYHYGYPDFLFYTPQTVSPAPTYSFATSGLSINPVSPVSTCLGTGVSIGATASGASGTVLYSWTPGTWLSDSTLATPVANPPANQIYTVTVRDGSGCTASALVQVNVNQTSTLNQNATICQGHSYSFGGHLYYTAGTYSDTIIHGSVSGCDSIVRLTLAIMPSSSSTSNQQACAGHPVSFAGRNYAVSGTYRDTIAGGASNGCDSIATLVLQVLPMGTSMLSTHVCAGDSVFFNGHYYHNSAQISDTLSGAGVNGCDSIANLDLTIDPLPSITWNPIDTIYELWCAPDYPWIRYVNLDSASPAGGNYSGVFIVGDSVKIPAGYRQLCPFDTTFAITYSYTDGNGCTNSVSRNFYYFTFAEAIDEVAGQLSISLYPNPNRGSFTIQVDKLYADMQYFITDELNRKVANGQIESTRADLDLKGVDDGLYMLQIYSGIELKASRKFTIAK